jgi:hypothetical protein
VAPKLILLKIYMCSDLVVRGGVEPPTFRFSGGRSYQLSYLTSTGAHEAECRTTPLPERS